MPNLDRAPRVAVIGGGISGLAAAHRLHELAPAAEVVLYEAADRLGGAIDTVEREGFLIDRGPDMFTAAEPWAVDLCRRLKIDEELISAGAQHRRAFVVRRGRLIPVPAGFSLMGPARIWPIVATPLLSPLGKLRLAWEYFVPRRREEGDECLASFARRRVGREVYERLVQPLVGGIHTADPERLSLLAALPRFAEMERRHGGLIRGMRAADRREKHRQAGGARYDVFRAFRGGMKRLVDALAERLPAGGVRLQTRVLSISRPADETAWQVESADGTTEAFDAVILAAPARAAGKLLEAIDSTLAAELTEIEYASAAVVCLGFRREQIAHPLDGFGFVVPLAEQRRILAASFSSVKFAGRAPAGSELIRVFVGGATQPELLDGGDDELRRIVLEELGELLGARGEPQVCEIARWPRAMPQYHVGHLARVTRIEERVKKLPNFELAGNAYRGVGIPLCVKSGELAAERVVQALTANVEQLTASEDARPQ